MRSGQPGRLARTQWPASDEEARAYVQARLTLLYQVMFWAYVAVIVSQVMLYEVWQAAYRPALQNGIYAAATSGLLVMAAIWRLLLLRRRLTLRALLVLDIAYALGSGFVLGACALFAYDHPPAQYVTLIYAYCAIFARTIILPSSGMRTMLAGGLLFGPLVVAAVVVAVIADSPLISSPAFAIGALMLSSVAIVLAATGSDIIYGLRQKITAAQQLGSYRLECKIGEGGMGAVYRAHHILLRRPTAIKLLHPDRVGADNLQRFEREVVHMSTLSHPNTVAVYDYGRSPDGVFYYAMEYLGGGVDLEHLVRGYGPQPNARVAQILIQICGALGEAHESGIIHRDIKPANVILCERGGLPDIAKVVDYGLAKIVAAPDERHTQQVVLGTPAYLAPEAITNPSTAGPAVDLYALGAVGYYLLTGKRVFDGKTAMEVCIQHVSQEPQPPSAVCATFIQPELEAIVMRCLRKAPEARFASAHDMADALRALPAAGDWDLAQARRWWRELAPGPLAAASTASTMSVTVDLSARQ